MNDALQKTWQWVRGLATGTERRPSLPLIALFAAVSVAILGYRFAVWDQLLYLSLVDRVFLPIVNHPNDLYISNFLWKSYTSFWLLFFPLKQMFGWEWPLFVIHLLVKFFMFWGIWSISYTLTKDRFAAWITVLFMLMNKAIVGNGVNLYMADTITRYVVLPFLLFGMKKLWEKKYLTSALLFGLGFQIHALSAVYWILAAVISFGIHAWITRKETARVAPLERRAEFRRIGLGILVFILLALPILVWFAVMEHHSPHDPATAEYLQFVHSRHGSIFLNNYDANTWRNLALTVVLIVVAVRFLPADGLSQWYTPWALGIVGVLFIHYLAADVFVFQPIFKLQMLRVVDMLGLLAMIGVARILSLQAQGTWQQRGLAAFTGALFLNGTVAPGGGMEFFFLGAFFVLLIALENRPGRYTLPALLILIVFLGAQFGRLAASTHGGVRLPLWSPARIDIFAVGVILFAVWFFGVMARRSLVRQALFTGGLCGLMFLVWFERNGVLWPRDPEIASPSFREESWREIVAMSVDAIAWPGTGMQDDWIKFQLWVRDNTPPGSIFFVPPNVNGFRVFSQRNAFFESYDAEPAIFQTRYAAALTARMKAFGYWPPNEFNSERAARTYQGFRDEDWQAFAQQWGVPYLITDSRVYLSFPKLHEQGRFTLWKIPPAASATNADSNATTPP